MLSQQLKLELPHLHSERTDSKGMYVCPCVRVHVHRVFTVMHQIANSVTVSLVHKLVLHFMVASLVWIITDMVHISATMKPFWWQSDYQQFHSPYFMAMSVARVLMPMASKA